MTYSRKWLLLTALLCSVWAPIAHAYRPFDGTDATVAEPDVFELEFSPLSYQHYGASRSVTAPGIVVNLGLEGDTEIMLEGRVNRLTGDTTRSYRTSLGDTQFSIK